MNDGGPAFPCPASEVEPDHGMSLRDYFAAHCPSDLAKCNVQSDAEKIAGSQPRGAGFAEELAWNNRIEAYLRYAYADAMIAARAEAPSVPNGKASTR